MIDNERQVLYTSRIDHVIICEHMIINHVVRLRKERTIAATTPSVRIQNLGRVRVVVQ